MKTKICFLALLILALKINAQTVTDYDGNVYPTVMIGTQNWMAENLSTTHYSNGTDIPLIDDWRGLTSASYSWIYYSDSTRYNLGALYNWYALGNGNVCPAGWHVPSHMEWSIMEVYLQNNGYNYDGSVDADNDRESKNRIAISLTAKLDESTTCIYEGTVGNPNYPAFRNKSGFSALLSGYIRASWGNYTGIDEIAYWWTSSETDINYAMCRSIAFCDSLVTAENASKAAGYSVRCVEGTVSSIKQISEVNGMVEVFLFPNPAKTEFSICYNLPSNNRISLQLMDITGRSVQDFIANEPRNAGEKKETLLLNKELLPGLYFVKLQTGGQKFLSKLFIE